jgi:hypothetical protein
VYDGGCAGPIHEVDAKALAGRKRDAGFSVRPDKAEYAGRFAVDGEGSGAGSEAKPSGAKGRGRSPRYRQKGYRAGHDCAGGKDLPPA